MKRMVVIQLALLAVAMCYGQLNCAYSQQRVGKDGLLPMPKMAKTKATAAEVEGFYLAAEGLLATNSAWVGMAEAGYRFSNRLAVGVGSGYSAHAEEYRTGAVVPLFASLRVNFLPYRLSPYVAVAGGLGLDFYTNTDSFNTTVNGTTVLHSKHSTAWGYYHAAAGLHLRCTDTFALHVGAAYNNITNAPSITAGISFTFVNLKLR